MMNHKNLAMSLSGLAAIVIDYFVVASIVGMLLLARWIGMGWMLDVLTVFLISCLIVAWFYSIRLSEFFSHQDSGNTNSSADRASVRH